MRALISVFALLAVVVVLSLPSCKHEPFIPIDPIPIDTGFNEGVPCNPDTAYFQNQILPLLVSQCAKSGCHDAGSHKEGVVLIDYQRVMSTGKVKAFNPADSKLYESIITSDAGDRMPQPPNAPLTTEQKNLIKKWIEQGAQNNVCNENYGTCNTDNITYSNFVSGLLANRCVGCHSGSSPQGGLKLTTYAEVKASAQSGALYGSVAHQLGYSAMPKGVTALSPCYVDKIKAWIDAGMPQ